MTAQPLLEDLPGRCVFCNKPAEGNYTVHRDGFGIGPEVALCNACAEGDKPTMHDVWSKVAKPSSQPGAFLRVQAGQVSR